MIEPTTVASKASRAPSPGTSSAPAARTSRPTPRSPHRTARSIAERRRSAVGIGRIEAPDVSAQPAAATMRRRALGERGAVPRRVAALLWRRVEARRSVVVAPEPPMSGKTTLLSSLVVFLADDTQPVFLRGLSETFDYAHNVDPKRG